MQRKFKRCINCLRVADTDAESCSKCGTSYSAVAPVATRKATGRDWKIVVAVIVGGLLVLGLCQFEVSMSEPEIDWRNPVVGDCDGITALATTTRTEYELLLRSDGCSEAQVARYLEGYDDSENTNQTIKWAEGVVEEMISVSEAYWADFKLDPLEAAHLCNVLPEWEADIRAGLEAAREVKATRAEELFLTALNTFQSGYEACQATGMPIS